MSSLPNTISPLPGAATMRTWRRYAVSWSEAADINSQFQWRLNAFLEMGMQILRHDHPVAAALGAAIRAGDVPIKSVDHLIK